MNTAGSAQRSRQHPGRGPRGPSGARTLAWLAGLAAPLLVAPAGLAQPEAPPDPAVDLVAPPPQGEPAPAPPAEQPPPVSTDLLESDGEVYVVDPLEIEYARAHPSHPDLADILDLEVQLLETPQGYAAPRPGLPTITLRLSEVESLADNRLSASALTTIAQAIVTEFNARGIIGVLVAPDPEQIDGQTGTDLRVEGSGLKLLIWTAIVRDVRTIASGQRMGREQRVNNPAQARIKSGSPVAPFDGPEDDVQTARRDLLRKDFLDDYLYRLNRHPGRRVDVAIAAAGAPGQTPGEVVLDYLVTENKPWYAYIQGSNTGTESTDEWRQRAGFVHNQLSGADDVLSLDFITALFDETNALIGSYERPLTDDNLVRARVYGSWSEYTAADVGLAGSRFEGTSWSGGAELSGTVFQHRQLFVDLLGGARWEHVEVTDRTFATPTEGEEDLFLPYLGVRLERTTEKASTSAQVTVETMVSGVSGADRDELQELGRLAVDQDWTVMKWDLQHTFFLEPLIFGSAWEDPNQPDKATLAHEVALLFRGQYAFDYRLIPQSESTAGGLFTVRGYPESIAAGDTVILATAEYRLHVPRLFTIEPDPSRTPLFGQPFRFAPQQVYGRPDWDLILRAFVDVGQVYNSNRLSFEQDQTLVGTGFGAEVLFKQNLSVRVDVGFALEEVDQAGSDNDVNSGDAEIHFVGTLLF